MPKGMMGGHTRMGQMRRGELKTKKKAKTQAQKQYQSNTFGYRRYAADRAADGRNYVSRDRFMKGER